MGTAVELGPALGRSQPGEHGIVREVGWVVYWVTFLNMEICGPQKAKGICLGGECETEMLDVFLKSGDICTKPVLFAQMAWVGGG